MGQRIYYHNITKKEYNINDFGDAVEQSDTNVLRLINREGSCPPVY
jgi:hypothetical protein